MSILIKNMGLPKSGRITVQIGADGAVYTVGKCIITSMKYEKSCPAYDVSISLPETTADRFAELVEMKIKSGE